MLFRNWVWTRKSAADRPLGNLDMRTRMVAPCENSLRLTGRVMDAKSSLDHCAIPAEPPSLRFPRPAKRWTGDRWKAAQVCPLPEPARCPSLPVARACRGLRQAQPPKTYAARACVSAAPRFSGAGIEGSGFGTCMQNMQCRQDQPTEGDVNESL